MMNEVIYLVCSRSKVERMTKNLPSLQRGEIPVKVTVKVEEAAFREPVIEKEITINDWREGIDMADVEFRGSVITKDEAELIRQARLVKMREILEAQGYEIVPLAENNSGQ